MECDQKHSKYFFDWREKLNKEMNVFNGKVAHDKGDDSSQTS